MERLSEFLDVLNEQKQAKVIEILEIHVNQDKA